MSADRRRPGDKTPASRPLQPRLAANATSTRSSPATAPRLAAQYISPNVAALRRPASVLGTETQTSEVRNPPAKDGGANVTPRSAARKLRPESATSTPVPSQGEKSAIRNRAPSNGSYIISEKTDSDINRLQGTGEDARRLQLSPSPVIGHTASSDQTSFFYANNSAHEKTPRRPSLPQKAATFIYANGTQEQTNQLPPRAETTVASLTPTIGRGPSSVLSAAPSLPPQGPSPFFRPTSPPKDNFHLTYRKGASQILRPSMQDSTSPVAGSHTRRISDELSRRRRSSIDGVEREPHMRSSSSSSVESATASAKLVSQLDVRTARSASGSSAHAVNSPSIPTIRSPLAEQATSVSRWTSPERPMRDLMQSPSADGNSFHSESAADARRERKVLDLEISNSSLLAINRSLEREVRKQKTELRRMRRMSRNSNRSVSLQSDLSAVSSQLSDLAEGDEEDGEEDSSQGQEDSESESNEDESLSASALAEKDERYRKIDTRRLKLDLTRHRELLIDSQKLNQSIKRCLGVTEQLIRDGTKALEYQVKVHDVAIGGRVLSPEELEAREDRSVGHLEDSYFEKWENLTPNVSAANRLPDYDHQVVREQPATLANPQLPSLDDSHADSSRQAPAMSATTIASELMNEIL